MHTFDIYVQDRRNGSWRERRTNVEAKDANQAVRAYVVSADRKHGSRKGFARSAKGKLFVAVPAGSTPPVV